MKDKIKNKIKELEKFKSDYLDMLDNDSPFTNDYICERLKEIRLQINILEEILEGSEKE